MIANAVTRDLEAGDVALLGVPLNLHSSVLQGSALARVIKTGKIKCLMQVGHPNDERVSARAVGRVRGEVVEMRNWRGDLPPASGAIDWCRYF